MLRVSLFGSIHIPCQCTYSSLFFPPSIPSFPLPSPLFLGWHLLQCCGDQRVHWLSYRGLCRHRTQ